MVLFLNFLILAIGFFALVKGADWFVDSAAGIAGKLGVPQLIIGLTIVAMGTSAPETAVSLTASLKNSADLAVGNVLGSNIINILLLLGITSIICPLLVRKSTLKFEMPFVILISVILMAIGIEFSFSNGSAISDGALTRIDGVILIALFLMYLAYLFYMAKHGLADDEEISIDKSKSYLHLVIVLLYGLGMVIGGSNLTIRGASKIAEFWGVPERIIGLTVVAFGTSLPELVTCIVAALKKNADIAIGNIVGSNIFNILFVLGISSLVTKIPYQASFMMDSIIAILSAAVLLACVAFNKKHVLARFSGILMLVLYAVYFVHLVRS